MTAKVFVGNLNHYTTESQLTDLLAEAGQVVDVYLPADRATGSAVVGFATEQEAAACVARFDGVELGGNRLRVSVHDADHPPL